MGTNPTTHNGAAALVNKVLRGGFDSAETAIKAMLAVEAPWTKWPVISQVISYILSKTSTFFYEFFSDHSTFFIIDFQTKKEKDEYLEALDQLKRHPTPQALEAARQALGRLIHADGST